jgi:hypothetical protein
MATGRVATIETEAPEASRAPSRIGLTPDMETKEAGDERYYNYNA